MGKGGCLCALTGGHATAVKDLYVRGTDQISKDIKNNGNQVSHCQRRHYRYGKVGN